MKAAPWVRIPPSPPMKNRVKFMDEFRKKEIIKAFIAIVIIVLAVFAAFI